MVIRDYKPADYPQIEKLWKETGIYKEERGDTPGSIRRCNESGGKFLVMVDPGTDRVTGTSWMTWDGRRIFLHHFAIAPPLQGRGYGRILAVHSLEFARKKGCSVKLEVHDKNTPAVRLYKSLGFEKFEDYGVYMLFDPGSAIGE